jgi:hypothetical protein
MPLIGAFPRRLVVAALAVGVLGCDRRPCASDPAAAVSAEQAVVFFETNQGGVSILSATGRRIKTLRIPPGQSVDSLTPDLSGWSFAQVRRGDPRRGTSELVVYVSWPQKGAYEVLRQEIDSAKSTAVGSYELQWITADGAAFFLRNLDELSLVRLCGSQLSHLPVAKDVAAFAHTDTRLYTLSRNKIRWRGIPESAQDHERGERVVPEAFDGVEIGPSPDQLVLFRKPPARAPALTDFYLLDVSTGNGRWLQFRGAGAVIAFLPIKGTGEAVVEVSEAQERFDGRALTNFYVWNYGNGNARRFFCESYDLTPQARPNNLYLPPSAGCKAEAPRPAGALLRFAAGTCPA